MFLINGDELKSIPRHRLIDGLGRLNQAYGAPSIVVFDGAAHLDLPHALHRRGVKVVYAGGKGRAQEKILRMMEDHPERTFTVVTQDRTMGVRVRARGGRLATVPHLRDALAKVDPGQDDRIVA